MKVVILAGGFGTRITEESQFKPKPMIEIGDKPILWHIMKTYSLYGFNEFIICAGYKQHVIKKYFADYYLHQSDITFDLSNENEMLIHKSSAEPWKITIADTGLNTMTGGRVKRIEKYVENETFMLTYGDGVSDINVKNLLDFHKKHRKVATLTAINVGQRFGVLSIDSDNKIREFREKDTTDGSVINGGYMVLEPEVFKYIDDDTTVFEKDTLFRLSEEEKLMAYRHDGFWKCMDTQRDLMDLQSMWDTGNAKWKKW